MKLSVGYNQTNNIVMPEVKPAPAPPGPKKSRRVAATDVVPNSATLIGAPTTAPHRYISKKPLTELAELVNLPLTENLARRPDLQERYLLRAFAIVLSADFTAANKNYSKLVEHRKYATDFMAFSPRERRTFMQSSNWFNMTLEERRNRNNIKMRIYNRGGVKTAEERVLFRDRRPKSTSTREFIYYVKNRQFFDREVKSKVNMTKMLELIQNDTRPFTVTDHDTLTDITAQMGVHLLKEYIAGLFISMEAADINAVLKKLSNKQAVSKALADFFIQFAKNS